MSSALITPSNPMKTISVDRIERPRQGCGGGGGDGGVSGGVGDGDIDGG